MNICNKKCKNANYIAMLLQFLFTKYTLIALPKSNTELEYVKVYGAQESIPPAYVA